VSVVPGPASQDAVFKLVFASPALQCNTKKIAKIQEKAVRVITKKPYLEHTAPLFKSLNILTYQQLIIYPKLNIMHSVIIAIVPSHSSISGNKIMNLTIMRCALSEILIGLR
jgi:hypothetical protein